MGESATIYWFSGTGNSRWLAGQLASLLGDCRLLPITRAIKSPIQPTPIIGLVFPVYASGPPKIVADFARQVAAPRSYTFTVATMAGSVGAVHAIVRGILRQAGTDLAAGWSVKMPNNCISLYQGQKESKQKKLFTQAAARLPRIAERIRSRKHSHPQDSIPPFNTIGGPMWAWAIRHFAAEDRKFRVTDACVHCGLCARICPVGDIVLADGRPVWQGRCQQCYGCINVCPVQAIQVGKITVGRRRFWHPEITHEQMAEQAK